MTNNDILRRLRYIFDLDDVAMIKLFQSGGQIVSRKQILGWLKKEEAPDQLTLPDINLAGALNGLIALKRGKKEGADPVAETRLNNNLILRKLKIALDLRDDDILGLLSSADMTISKHELSALFRKPGHKHYRECKDQLLRNFLFALQNKHRDSKQPPKDKPRVQKQTRPEPKPSGGKKSFEWKIPNKGKGPGK